MFLRTTPSDFIPFKSFSENSTKDNNIQDDKEKWTVGQCFVSNKSADVEGIQFYNTTEPTNLHSFLQ